MRREICGECGSPISDDGACDCTELLKRGWRVSDRGMKMFRDLGWGYTAATEGKA